MNIKKSFLSIVFAINTVLGLSLLTGCDGTQTLMLDGSSMYKSSADASPFAYSFVVLGDTQHPTNSCTLSGQPTMAAVPRAIAIVTPAPHFVLHLGDLVEFGGDPGAYAAFVSCYADILMRFPLFPTLGNHDWDLGLGIGNYKSYLEEQLFIRNKEVVSEPDMELFSLFYNDDPTNYSTDITQPTLQDIVPSGVSFKTFYAFRYKNSYFISFEQNLPIWINTPKPWVEKHLSQARADPAIDHIFIFMHNPLNLSLKSEDDPYDGLSVIRKHYEPLFKQYDVTMVFSGHHHVYSHAYVPDDGSPTRMVPGPTVYSNSGNAIHYIVSGGGSWSDITLPIELKEKSYDYVQALGTGNHFLVVQVEEKKLVVTAHSVFGSERRHATQILDTFTIIP